MAYKEKKFIHNVYTFNAGTYTYYTTWSDDVVSVPSFKMIINGGLGEMKIRLARTTAPTIYGENQDVRFANKVETLIFDKESLNGTLFYSGYIIDYEPFFDGQDEYVDVTVMGFASELENMVMLIPGGNTAITYTSQTSAYIIGDIISNYRAAGGIITAGVITNPANSLSYDFNMITNAQAINKIKDASPANYYWFVNAGNSLSFVLSNLVTPNHTFIVGKHISKLTATKTMKDLINSVKFIGGINPATSIQIYKEVHDSTSITDYGKREYIMNDNTVIVPATALALANNYLAYHKNPFVRATLTIIDSNGDDENGYDIESILPGQTCIIYDPYHGTAGRTYDLTNPMIIQSVQYDYDSVTIELSIRPPWVVKRIQDIYNDLNRNALVGTWNSAGATPIPVTPN